MRKIVYMLYYEGYQKPTIDTAMAEEDVSCFQDFYSRVSKKLFEWHNAWPLNKRHELPLKQLWFSRILKGLDITENDDIWFLMYESFHLSYSKKFLTYLRKKYKKARICYMFTNPVDEYNREKVCVLKPYYDAIITFYYRDAEQYDFLFMPLQPMKVPVYGPKDEFSSDVFFVGKAKGRLDTLLKCYEKFTKAGLKCDFHIVDVPENKQKYSDAISYNKRIPYSEVLEREASSKCVLEILQDNDDYISMRAAEAFGYGKKLITNSSAYRQYSFYDPDRIWILDDIDTFDKCFVEKKISSTMEPISSFDKFRTFLHAIDRKQ